MGKGGVGVVRTRRKHIAASEANRCFSLRGGMTDNSSYRDAQRQHRPQDGFTG